MRWDEATLPALQVVTPKSPGEKVATPEELLERSLKISKWNPSLTLLYFHTPHEELDKSKLVGAAGATFRQCKTFFDEEVARWLSLYHPVEVDMGASDAKTAERLGFKDGAMFAVIDQDMNVIATSKPLAKSENVAAFLKATIKSEKCAKYWEPIQKQVDEQKKTLEEARSLAAKQMYKEALEKYKLVLSSNVRIAEFWDDASKEAEKVQRKAEKQ